LAAQAALSSITSLLSLVVTSSSDAAEEQLAELYRSVAITGGDPLAQARNIVRQQRDAQAEAKQAHEALDQNLRDLTPQLLIDKIERVEASIAAYDSKRDPAMSAPADLADAKPVSEAAAAAVDEVRRLEAELQEKSEQAEAVLAGVQEAANLRAAHGQMARQTTAATEQDLEAARRKISDAELDQNRREREQDAANVEAVHTRRASELAGDDPDSVASLLQNGQEVLDRLRRDHTTLELDLARIKSELEVRGETGLHDQLATVKSELAEREREATLTDRRAAAADLLYTRLGANRDACGRSWQFWPRILRGCGPGRPGHWSSRGLAGTCRDRPSRVLLRSTPGQTGCSGGVVAASTPCEPSRKGRVPAR
jgi:chromosome segregation ATPase